LSGWWRQFLPEPRTPMERYWMSLNGGRMPTTGVEWHRVAIRHRINVKLVQDQLIDAQCDMIRRRLLR